MSEPSSPVRTIEHGGRCDCELLAQAMRVSRAQSRSTIATLERNTCRTPSNGPDAPTFEVLTTVSTHQQRALALIHAIQP